jgi:hypothetical protein
MRKKTILPRGRLMKKRASAKSLYRKFSDLISLREKVAQAELAANASDKGKERAMPINLIVLYPYNYGGSVLDFGSFE